MDLHDFQYSDNWRDLDTVLLYRCPSFQFGSSVIITSLDDCLVCHISQNKMYDTMNETSLKIYSQEYINQLRKDATDHSVVIISNETSTIKRNIDMIKKKMEFIVSVLGFPVIGLFALKRNKFMKPHTGLWKLLNAFYRSQQRANIHKARVISNAGGMILEKTVRKEKLSIMGFSDVDRAFAHNIGIEFITIGDYLKYAPLKYKWDSQIIPPETRAELQQEISKHNAEGSRSVFKELGKHPADIYVIFIMGPPRSGKTTYAKEIIDKWENSSFGICNAVERLSYGTLPDEYTEARRFKMFKKLIDDRISVVIDGNCYTMAQRKQYVQYVTGRNISMVCVDVTCGMRMARVFNHAHVEQSTNDRVCLYPALMYDVYRSSVQKPISSERISYMVHVPEIKNTKEVMEFRY